MKRVYYLSVLLLAVSSLFGLDAKFKADSLNGSLGDVISFSWDINHSTDAAFSLKEFDMDGTGIEILSQIQHKSADGSRLLFETAVYDSVGIYHFPPLTVYVEDMNGLDSLYLQGPDLEISSVLSASDTTFRDIKGLHKIRTPFNLMTLLWIIGLVIIFYLIFILIKRFKRTEKARQLEVVVIPPEDAHVMALRDFEKLKRSKYLRFEQFKDFHTELTHILKQYYENRYLIDALELTTSKLMEKIEGMDEFDATFVSETHAILEQADLIKFAKATSNELESGEALMKSIDIVNRTKIQTIKETTRD